MIRPFVILVSTLVFSFAHASENEPKALAVVQDYVGKEKGWPPRDYKIEKRGRDNDYDVYFVTYVPDTLRSDIAIPGTLKSFFAIYDSRMQRVVKERYLQYPVIQTDPARGWRGWRW